jgi:CYTH domain-containing protein
MCQGYLSIEKLRTIRVRTACQKGFITIKGLRNGFSRPEYEYEIPLKDALEMLESLCLKPVIEKVRYKVMHNNSIWEVDVFENENAGLIIAELELDNEDARFELPDWAGEEVTSDSRYSNSNLVKNPFPTWDNKST